MKMRIPLIVIALIIVIFGFLFLFSHLWSVHEDTTQKIYLNYGGLDRSYLIHIPPQYDNRTSVPLVIVLHGGGGSAENIENVTGFNSLADKEDFIVVYPEGVDGTWNSGHCCGSAMNMQVDDVGFILTVIEDVESSDNIDKKMVYATGFSNGAMMAYTLASNASNVFAAVGPVSGTIGGQARDNSSLYLPPSPSQVVSVIAFHGTADQNVLYNGGHGNETTGSRIDLSVNDSIQFWVKSDNCSNTPIYDNVSSNVTMETYNDGLNDSEVKLYTIIGGGHAWPGGVKASLFGDEPTQEISATDLIWEFFKSHPKNS